jgi:hypothetical protein
MPVIGGTNVPGQYVQDVMRAARDTGLPPAVVAAQIDYESGFNPHAVSSTGAEGIAQFEPGTWPSYGRGSPFNPSAAFAAYGNFMRVLLAQEHGSVRNALAAYNAGPGNVAAGYGYADHILRQAKLPASESVTTGGGFGLNTLTQAAGIPGQITSFFTSAAYALDWWLQPSNRIRVMAGIGGALLLLSGVWIMSHVGGDK